MTASQHDQETILSYLQLDAPARRPRFADFVGALKAVSQQEDPETARGWAARAVSPLLDYSSLMKLRRYVNGPNAGTNAGRVVRLAILGGPTTIQLRQLIELFLANEGIAAEMYEAEYGLFRQEILTPGSGLDQFGPEIVFVATGARDLTRVPPLEADAAAVEQFAETELSDWLQLWETARSRWNATLIQNNFDIPFDRILGHYTLRHPAARENYLARLNRQLADAAPAFVVMHDLNALAAEAGAAGWFDPRFYHEFKMPCGAECLPVYAHSVVSLLRAMLGRSKKVLALDLDNTLWGGVVGDLGPGGIKFGQGSGEGEAFLAFQRYAKDLSLRGIVLAVCSKNDPEKAREPFEKRADMVLRRATSRRSSPIGITRRTTSAQSPTSWNWDSIRSSLSTTIRPSVRSSAALCRKSRYPICRRIRRATPRRSLVTVILRRRRSRGRIRPGLAIIPRTRGGKSWRPARPTWNRFSPRCT